MTLCHEFTNHASIEMCAELKQGNEIYGNCRVFAERRLLLVSPPVPTTHQTLWASLEQFGTELSISAWFGARGSVFC